MLTEMHFIPVFHALVEPDFKLIIQRRQIRIDEDPYLEFGYDPLIGRDNLTMLLSENLHFLYKGRESEIPQVLFRSKQYVELKKVFLKIRSTPEGLQIVAHCGDNGLRYAVEFLKRTGFSCDNPYDVFHHMLKASIDLDAWDGDTKELRTTTCNISFYLSIALRSELEAHSSFAFEQASDSEVLLAQRETRS